MIPIKDTAEFFLYVFCCSVIGNLADGQTYIIAYCTGALLVMAERAWLDRRAE